MADTEHFVRDDVRAFLSMLEQIGGKGVEEVGHVAGREQMRTMGSLAEAEAASLPVIRDIVVRHEGEAVLVVSHKATIRLLISSLLGFDARGYRDRLDQHPCCLNILDFKDPVRARLMLFNDVSHYEDVPERILTAHLSKWWDSPQPPK